MNMSKTSDNPWPAGVSKPAQRALAGAGFTCLEQLANVRESELLKLHGMGPKAMDALKKALAGKGLTFAKDKQ
jgi:DNA-directed RNA polymerase alpha subunit